MQDINIDDFEKKIWKAKTQIDKQKPFDQTQLKNLQKRFQIGFTYNSNAIEGNSYTLEEVRLLLEDGITVGGKPLKEQKETENHGKVVDTIRNFIDKKSKLTDEFILKLHKNIFDGVIEDKYLGKYRDIQVMIVGEQIAPPKPSDITGLMNNYIDYVNVEDINILEKIAKIHYDFVKIHPFVDGNGRVARLLMNVFLLQEGFLPIIFPVVVRNQYIYSLKSENDFEDFYKFFLWQLWENIKDYKRMFENN